MTLVTPRAVSPKSQLARSFGDQDIKKARQIMMGFCRFGCLDLSIRSVFIQHRAKGFNVHFIADTYAFLKS
jgi:hypothetical protein